MSRPFSVPARDALEVTETPFGSVGVLHAGRDVNAWWVWKEREELDPEWTVFDREDVLYVVSGALKLELRDAPAVVLGAGDVFVIPAEAAFRGFRWPRDGDEPCVFVAVAPADVSTRKEPIRESAR